MTPGAPARAGSALCLCAALLAGCGGQPGKPAPQVAATNSYLASAVRDVLGEHTEVLQLAGPGMCPGHFDIRPSQVRRLRQVKLLLRFDFQRSLDEKLNDGSGGSGPRIVEARIGGGLCEPDSYLAACRQTAEALTAAGLLGDAQARGRIARIECRIGELAARQRRRLSGISGSPVIASVHQAAFCRWLGLDVVATFKGADVESALGMDEAVRVGRQRNVRLVIANMPEGRRAADALADGLGAAVAVFGNFPGPDADRGTFDALLEGNVSRLLEAVGS